MNKTRKVLLWALGGSLAFLWWPNASGDEPTTDSPPARSYYANCSEARVAGVAPLFWGESGYRSGLDRDSDGIACE